MIKSIWWYLDFIITLALKTPQLLYSKRILKKKGQAEYDRYVYDVSSKWAAKRLKNSGANIVIHNAERIPQRNVLFVSNHQSNFDIAIFMAKIKKDVGFVSKIEIGKVPLLGRWTKAIHSVFLDRNDLKQSLGVISEGIKLLKNGYSMVVFPEGTRSQCDVMGEFKAGSFRLAVKSGAPIVPITIDGSYKIMEGNGYVIKPASVDVYIHEPIYMENLGKEEKAAIGERVESIIKEPIKDKQRNFKYE